MVRTQSQVVSNPARINAPTVAAVSASPASPAPARRGRPVGSGVGGVRKPRSKLPQMPRDNDSAGNPILFTEIPSDWNPVIHAPLKARDFESMATFVHYRAHRLRLKAAELDSHAEEIALRADPVHRKQSSQMVRAIATIELLKARMSPEEYEQTVARLTATIQSRVAKKLAAEDMPAESASA